MIFNGHHINNDNENYTMHNDLQEQSINLRQKTKDSKQIAVTIRANAIIH
jgi:hypothetical protein